MCDVFYRGVLDLLDDKEYKMKFRIGEKVNYVGKAELVNPCVVMINDNPGISNIIDSVGMKLWISNSLLRLLPPKYYYTADIYDLLVRVYNQTPEQIAEALKVKRIWCEGNGVVCEEFGEEGDDNVMEVGTDDLVQYLCRLVDE